MDLTLGEKDGLLVAMAAEVARRRLARGVRLNYPEAVALITDAVVEGARDGRSVADVAEAATHVLRADQLMDGIVTMIEDVEVEATFPDGARIVSVHRPIRDAAPGFTPGEIEAEAGDITMNAHHGVLELEVENSGDRPIEIGSHYHFAEANPALRFDRAAARGKRLDLVPGTTVRFEPGRSRTVRLVDVGGAKEIVGFRGEVMGALGS